MGKGPEEFGGAAGSKMAVWWFLGIVLVAGIFGLGSVNTPIDRESR
jgi:hypothetical protein